MLRRCKDTLQATKNNIPSWNVLLNSIYKSLIIILTWDQHISGLLIFDSFLDMLSLGGFCSGQSALWEWYFISNLEMAHYKANRDNFC